MANIYVYSPAGAVRDRAAVRRGVRYLQQMGHEVTVDTEALASHMRFAGDDATRLQALVRAARSGADLTLITRGGYGLTRLLAHIDYKAIARSIAAGTRWMGYSDFTALQSALYSKTGAQTYAGAALLADFGSHPKDGKEVDALMRSCFEDTLAGRDMGAGWILPKAERPLYPQLRLSGSPRTPCVLWGGNLTVLTSLIGTGYLPQIKGGILWFEDVGEHPYQIERHLTTWLHAGLLQQQRALVFGKFSDSPAYPGHDRGFKLQTVIEWVRSRLRIPVLTGLPFGHVPTRVVLPFGVEAQLLCDGREALLLWTHAGHADHAERGAAQGGH